MEANVEGALRPIEAALRALESAHVRLAGATGHPDEQQQLSVVAALEACRTGRLQITEAIELLMEAVTSSGESWETLGFSATDERPE